MMFPLGRTSGFVLMGEVDVSNGLKSRDSSILDAFTLSKFVDSGIGWPTGGKTNPLVLSSL